MLNVECSLALRRLFLFTTILIFLQLILGATMRHQHAGLAIADFPLAHGQLWPDTSAEAVARYNQQRMEINNVNPITAFQIWLQMAHRLMAVLILAAVTACAWRTLRPLTWRDPLAKLAAVWWGLIIVQATLGALTVWWNKPADIATAHVLVGALSLATGTMLCIISARRWAIIGRAAQNVAGPEGPSGNEISFAARMSAP